MPGGKVWTDSEIAELRRLVLEHPNLSANELDQTIGAILGKSGDAINTMRSRLHITCLSSFRFRPPRSEKQLRHNAAALGDEHEKAQTEKLLSGNDLCLRTGDDVSTRTIGQSERQSE